MHRPWLSPRQLRRSMIDFIDFPSCRHRSSRTGTVDAFRSLVVDDAAGRIGRWLVDLYRRFGKGYKPNRKKRN